MKHSLLIAFFIVWLLVLTYQVTINSVSNTKQLEYMDLTNVFADEATDHILTLNTKMEKLKLFLDFMISDHKRIDLKLNLLIDNDYDEDNLTERQVKALQERYKKMQNPLM
ncbi:MAG: hypothetical protein KAS30_01785 [Candidatus Diapherotrites archaeon]|nr:hypothetical protein [Candidatus Diapherotrites archaeon]